MGAQLSPSEKKAKAAQEAANERKMRGIALIVSFLCFVFGFWTAGNGLQKAFPVGLTEQLAWMLAAIIVLMVTGSYTAAVLDFRGKRRLALAFFLLFAFVTFTFNLNSLYINATAKSWVREELSTYIQNVDRFYNAASKASDDARIGIINFNASKDIASVLTQIGRGGKGPEARRQLAKLHKDYGFEIPDFKDCEPDRRKLTKSQIAECVEDYDGHLKRELSALALRYTKLNVDDDISRAVDGVARLKREAEEKLKPIVDEGKAELLPKDFNTEHLIPFRTACDEFDKAVRQGLEKNQPVGAKTPDKADGADAKDDASGGASICEPQWLAKSPNENLGSLPFLFSQAIWREGALFWIFLVSLIDFIVPLALYLLVHKKSEEKPIKFFETHQN
ncbi:MAG: hypothetical protein LBC37_08370 [Zoogloeaceae bacterium]|jgi:hypothetical protein|nr:hypothetical protein [Zoogloeaceae bacterium]